MAIQEFLQWVPSASPVALAEGADKLAHAFVYGGLQEPEREDARQALTLLLDHASPLIRRALAENFAGAANVPHYMVHTLANDASDVAAIVLASSPQLSDAELVDCVAKADAFAQSAIALRPRVSPPVAAALAEVGALEALIALAINPGAELMEFSIRRMIDRYGHDEDLRAALLARPELPASLRCDLTVLAAGVIAARQAQRTGLPQEKVACLTRDARERAIITTAAEAAADTREMLTLVAHLRRTRQLTAGLLLRGLLCGNKYLLEVALCDLTGVAMPRVAGLGAESRGAGFAALYRKARMPQSLLPAFRAGLEAAEKSGCGGPMTTRLQKPIIDSVLCACASINDGGLDHIIAALHRLEAEAAREEARDFRRALAPAPPALRAFGRPRTLPPAAAPDIDARPAHAASITIDLEALEAELLAA
ncbi:MAG: DUF2336 domain-containing protein [Beijerinckiaceae bacterium]|nr:DUF2336 domain-containing protein [Beijerinckiaceae bacterium]